jgi:hypothetical protein
MNDLVGHKSQDWLPFDIKQVFSMVVICTFMVNMALNDNWIIYITNYDT